MTRRAAAECLLLSIRMAAEGPGTLVYQYIHWAYILMARVSFIITIELDRGQKHLNFILSMGLSLPDAGIPVSHHSLSWRQHHITTGEEFLPLPHLITFMLPLLSPDCKLLLLTMCELMEPYFR